MAHRSDVLTRSPAKTVSSFEDPGDLQDPEQQRLFQAMHTDGTSEGMRDKIAYDDADAYKLPRLFCRDWAAYQKRILTSHVALDMQTAHEGKVSATARGRGQHCGLLRHVKLVNGGRYRLSFWYKTHNVPYGADWGVGLYRIADFPLYSDRADKSTEWRQFVREFTVIYPPGDEADATLALYLESGNADD